MGRNHRSSSLGNAPAYNTVPSATSSSSSTQTQVDLTAAHTLLNHFVHGTNHKANVNSDIVGDGKPVFHRVIAAASSDASEESKLDGLFLLESLCTKMKEIDSYANSNNSYNSSAINSNNNQSNKAGGTFSGHLKQLLTSRDTESGYTSVHSAILNRDLMTLLLLLGHASSSLHDVGEITSTQLQMLHPLRLLDGNLDFGDDEQQYDIMNGLAAIVDNEKLTPLQLLGKTSSSGLEHCRMSLTWKSLRRVWKQLSMNEGGQQHGGSSERNESEENPRRHRRRMISFGDDQDYDSNYGIENGGDQDARAEREQRGRSGSFNVDLGNDQDDEGSVNGANNDLQPLENVDFGVLRENEGTGDDSSNQEEEQDSSTPKKPQHSATGGDEYGCEVLTFGRSDHCALGVPQYTTSSGRGSNDFRRGSSKDGEDNFLSKSPASYKPKRVETFALGQLRRKRPQNSIEMKRDTIDSPAVSIAASTHHTLVSTQSGQLYSFGYGKSGRLGTGDEHHRPLPTRVLGPLTKRIVASIAAAANHSLCSTNDGRVYAWGSNGFGQLGYSSSSNSGKDQDENSSRLSPRRVEGELKHSFVVAVAAGDRHSVALTKLGEVYCWGDNRSGQLGIYNGGSSSSPSSPSQANNHRPQRVEGLWSSAQPERRRKTIAIAASEFATLVLTMPPKVSVSAGEASAASSSLASLPVNTVYGWGHGNHSVLRVVFPTANPSDSSRRSNNSANVYSRSICINPIAIACAKYHNVAITADGRVYTWGLHSESLGIEKSPSKTKNNDSEWATASEGRRPRSNSLNSSSPSSSISSPQLVVGMLPENGGGKAVAVSASESHTAVVSSDGHLFTWGTSGGKDVMGHKGVRWQPSPRKVQRVHRAVGVAAAKEHTVLLMGTTFPPLPSSDGLVEDSDGYQPLSLQECAAIEISRNVDLFNVIPISLVARRLNCTPLIKFCAAFTHKNLDGVLAVGNKNDFMTFLSSGRMALAGATRSNYDREGTFHPFLYQLVNSSNWIESSPRILKGYAGSILPQGKKSKRRAKAVEPELQASTRKEEANVKAESNQRCTPVKVSDEKKVVSSGVKPGRVSFAREESLKDESQVPQKLFEGKAAQGKTSSATTGNASKYHCEVCNVSCPDADSYTLHMNGRRHRNRLTHARAQEEKQVAESMMAMKRMQLMEKSTSKGNDVTLAVSHQSMSSKPMATKKSTSPWATPTTTPKAIPKPSSGRKARSKSFQDILNEEQKNSSKAQGKFTSHPISTKQLPVLRSAAASHYHIQTPQKPSYNMASSPISSPSLTLSAFMKSSGEKPSQKTMSSIGASWGSKQAKTNSSSSWGAKPVIQTSVGKNPTPSKLKSFSEIQREEEAVRNNEDHMCRIDGNEWFIQQRERAASIGEILEQEKKEREMNAMIEEQRQIEEEIRKQLEQEKKEAKKQKKKGHGQRQKKSNKPNKARNTKPKKNPKAND